MSKSLIVINVLGSDDFGDCHIKSSINVPLDKLADYAHGIDKETEIIVYCASFSCEASTQAYHMLKGLGFANVMAYEGGMAQWYQLQYPIEGACQQAYLGRQEDQEDRGVPTVSAQELKKKMEQAGLFSL